MGSLDAEARARRGGAAVAMPRLADLCIVELAERDQPLVVAHADEAVADEVPARARRPAAPRAHDRAPRSSRRRPTRRAPTRRCGATVSARSCVLPLDAHGGPLGEITLARRQPFDAVDLVLAEQLAHRAAARAGERPPLRAGAAGDPRPRRVPVDRLARAAHAADPAPDPAPAAHRHARQERRRERGPRPAARDPDARRAAGRAAGRAHRQPPRRLADLRRAASSSSARPPSISPRSSATSPRRFAEELARAGCALVLAGRRSPSSAAGTRCGSSRS